MVKPSRLTFRLRTLLLAVLIIGGALGWWLRPFTVETHWRNGQVKSRHEVRRRWNGEMITSGQQQWWWPNGELAQQGLSADVPVKSHDRLFLTKLRNVATFDSAGKRVDDASEIWLGFRNFSMLSAESPEPPVWPVDMSFPETPQTSTK